MISNEKWFAILYLSIENFIPIYLYLSKWDHVITVGNFHPHAKMLPIFDLGMLLVLGPKEFDNICTNFDLRLEWSNILDFLAQYAA